MQTSTWKHIGIAFATLGGLSISAAALWALYGNALIPAERLLPDDTAIMVSDMDAQHLKLLQTWMPAARGLPAAPQNATVALIPQNGALEAAVLTPSRSPWKNAYDLKASDTLKTYLGRNPEGGAGRPDASLERDATYKLLSAQRAPGMPWIYVNPRLLGSGASVTPWSWLKASSPLGISVGKNRVSISMADDATASALPTLGTTLPMAFTVPVLTLRGTDLPMLLERLGGAMDTSVRITAGSKATEAVRRALGKELSVSYDILPLFRQSSTFSLGKDSAAGPMRFLAEGTFDGEEKIIEIITDSFRSSIPAFRRQTMTFEEGFTSDILAADDQPLTVTEDSREGWSVRVLEQKETGQILIIAVKGDRFVLSDSASAVDAWISQALPSVRLSGFNGSFVAGGVVNRALAGGLLGALLGPAWNTEAVFPPSFGNDVTFSLTRQRKRLTLDVESAPQAGVQAR